ncbi:MAG: YggT family protein [Clostridia bacterium]|nr:YggT family protein [Clostridia bacterium]
MEQIYYIVSGTVNVAVKALIYTLLIRVVMSLFVDEEEPSRIYIFCCAVTEPVVSPTRALLGKIKALDGFPIDLSYFATAFILITIETALRFF